MTTATLLLRLAGPLQSWGDSSRFAQRQTRSEPTKSGVLGLVAAAQGRRRSDPIEDLADLTFGVRIDQPGELLRDFHTAHRFGTDISMPLSYRYYLADAVFVAGLQGDRVLLHGIQQELRQPSFPLYLGRRSCPPGGLLTLGIRDEPLLTALISEPWQASIRYQTKQPRRVHLPVVLDAEAVPQPEEYTTEVVRDVPVSFSPTRRDYLWRDVIRLPHAAEHDNPRGNTVQPDFMATVVGA